MDEQRRVSALSLQQLLVLAPKSQERSLPHWVHLLSMMTSARKQESRKSSSDVPRREDQVKYERKKLRSKHEKDHLAELIILSNNGFLRNVQVGPGVSAVLATEEQLTDVFKFLHGS